MGKDHDRMCIFV